MQKYLIKYGLSGGFGGAINGRYEYFETEEEAIDFAEQCSIDEYESYEGLYGLRTVEEIMEEENLGDDEAFQEYLEERNGWLDYSVEAVPEDAEEDSDYDSSYRPII